MTHIQIWIRTVRADSSITRKYIFIGLHFHVKLMAFNTLSCIGGFDFVKSNIDLI